MAVAAFAATIPSRGIIARMRRVMWLFPCWMACTSAAPPADAAGSAKEAAPAPEPVAAAAPVCEPGATRPCYPGPEGTNGVGTCTSGVERCSGAAWGECKDAVVPAAADDCRTPLDENCNGRTDDCPEAGLALAVALTRARSLRLESWGGGLGIVGGPIFWVVEPGGRVVDPWEEAALDREPAWERNPESSEAETTEVSGAWPGALLRSHETGGTRSGYVIMQERWDGTSFSGVENSDENLQWRYENAIPWRDGHAIAIQRTFASFEAMEQLDGATLDNGSITAGEQRTLQTRIDGLLAKAKPRLVFVPAGAMEVETSYDLFAAAGEGEGNDKGEAPPSEDGAADEAAVAGEEAVEGEEAPALPQPPALPDELQSFVVLSDGTIAILGGPSRIWSWKPGQRRWTMIEPPVGFTLEGRDASLHAGPSEEIILRDCDQKQATGTLWRFRGGGWEQLWMPTTACPRELVTAPDLTRYVITGDQLWQRRHDGTDPWKHVTLPAPWKPRQVAWFDGSVWVAAEGEGGQWAVLVDRPVETVRELAAK